MTNEEKAKAYDEALKWMRELYPGLHGATKEDAEHYFPELRGSEDERIRKWLIDYFSSIKKTVWIFRDITCEQILAYLEKQKEQKPAENDCKFIDEKFMETDFWKQYVKDSIIPGNKPTQQDIDFLLPQAENLFALATKDMCNGCKDWSRGYNAGFANAEKAEREKSVIVTKQEYDSHSIVTRDAVSVKPAEWSEEDEKMRQGCIDSVEYELLDNGMDDEVETDPRIVWLKSLRPSWKPNDNQMSMLRAIVNDPNNVGAESCHLAIQSLYNDLLKLVKE